MTKQQNIPSGYNPDSYRDSPLGQIPSDWEVIELGEVFEYINTSSFSRDNLTNEKTENEVYYIHYGDIHATYKSELLDFGIETRVPFLKDEFCNDNFNFLKEGDLVIADASEDYKGIGESIEIKNINNKKVIGGLHTLVIRDKATKTSNGFRTYLFRNPNVHNEIKKLATGISVYGISKGNLSKLKLPLPPLPEQRAIAACLCTWDNAITKVQAILAQRELRKKWLMQNLLTGKKRLKGFDGEWKEYKLEYFIEEYNEKPKDGNKYEVLTSAKSGLMKQTDYYGDNRITNREDADYNIIPPNYITYRSRSDDGLFTFNKNTLGFTGLISGYYPVFTIKNGDIDFILMYCNYYRQKLTQYSIGTSQLVLSINALKSASFILPFTEEQTAIAQVLRAADKEIQLLKNKLEKLKEQKKGLMQVLLTGKKRLAVKN